MFYTIAWCVSYATINLLVPPFCSLTLADNFSIVASTGDLLPGTDDPLITFTPPALNDAGEVVFLSQLATENSPFDDHALLRATASSLTVEARKGVTTLDSSVITNFINNSPGINNEGVIAHSAERDSDPGKFVPFLSESGPLEAYLTVGSSSPSGMNTLFSNTIPVIDESGTAVYRASYSGSNFETGIYTRTSAGTTTLLFAEGEYGATEFVSLFFSLPTVNDFGQVGLAASVDDGFFTRKAIIRLDGTTVNELVRDGNTTTDGTTTIANILSNSVPINGAGQLAFEALYFKSGVSQRQGVFAVNDGSKVLLTPDLLPGASTSATNVRVTAINDLGIVSFTSEFTGSGDLKSGVYLADSAETTLVAFEDTATPADGKFFRRFFTESLALNQSGQLAFLAELSNSVDGAFAGRGLYRYDPTDGLETILQTGYAFAGSTISSLNFVGDFYSAGQPINSQHSPDGNFSGINSEGAVAFVYSLATGESGIAVWTPSGSELPGDYNSDGIVDAADYTVWRNHFNEMFTLDNEKPDPMTPGIVDEEDYEFWKLNYGNIAGTGSLSALGGSGGLATPEPLTSLLALTAAFMLAFSSNARRRRTRY